MRRILIVGATSAMAHETAKRFARDGASLSLAARDPERLAAVAADLRVRGAERVHEFRLEATELARYTDLLAEAVETLGGLDAVLIAHGELPDQQRCEEDPAELVRSLTVNGLSVVWLLTVAANLFERQKHGCLAVISSGAGERGRRSTYAYGMAKSLITVCLQGLRARLHPAGVSVLTIVPCFVDTPMTAYLPERLRWISPRRAGLRIHEAMRRGKDLVYIPWYWRWVLMVARNLPEGWFKRLRTEQRLLERLDRGPIDVASGERNRERRERG